MSDISVNEDEMRIDNREEDERGVAEVSAALGIADMADRPLEEVVVELATRIKNQEARLVVLERGASSLATSIHGRQETIGKMMDDVLMSVKHIESSGPGNSSVEEIPRNDLKREHPMVEDAVNVSADGPPPAKKSTVNGGGKLVHGISVTGEISLLDAEDARIARMYWMKQLRKNERVKSPSQIFDVLLWRLSKFIDGGGAPGSYPAENVLSFFLNVCQPPESEERVPTEKINRLMAQIEVQEGLGQEEIPKVRKTGRIRRPVRVRRGMSSSRQKAPFARRKPRSPSFSPQIYPDRVSGDLLSPNLPVIVSNEDEQQMDDGGSRGPRRIAPYEDPQFVNAQVNDSWSKRKTLSMHSNSRLGRPIRDSRDDKATVKPVASLQQPSYVIIKGDVESRPGGNYLPDRMRREERPHSSAHGSQSSSYPRRDDQYGYGYGNLYRGRQDHRPRR